MPMRWSRSRKIFWAAPDAVPRTPVAQLPDPYNGAGCRLGSRILIGQGRRRRRRRDDEMMNELEQDRPDAEQQLHADRGLRYTSLGDYVRVVRRHKILIGLIVLGFVGVALLQSLSKSETYRATAQLAFRDLLADFRVVGGDGVPELSPAQRAATNAELLTRSEVTRRAKALFDERSDAQLSATQLRNAVSARVGVQTNLVVVDAVAGTAQLAADIASVYSEAAEEVGEREARRQLRLAQISLEREARNARRNLIPGVSVIRVATLEGLLSRIVTLRQISDPIEIVQPAEVPGRRISPNPQRDAVLGAMLGLVFGLLAAFGRDALDRRLRTPHEVYEELGLAVLGRVGEGALGRGGLAAANGAGRMTEAEFEAFRVLRMNLGALDPSGKMRSILVTSGLPQEGKSTVSASLASAAALADRRVLLVECDLRRPSFATRMPVKRGPGLTDYLIGKAEPQEILQVVRLTAPVNAANGSSEAGQAGSFVCVTAGSQAGNPAELLISDRFKEFLAKVTKAYDLVVIDSSPLLAVVDSLELVAQVDAVLVCVRAQQTTRDQVHAVRSALENVSGPAMGAVVTGMRRGGPDSYDYYYGY